MKKIPQGYKKTKVGIVPKEWKEIILSSFVNEKIVYCNDEKVGLGSLTIEKGVVPKPARYNREHLVKDTNDAYKLIEANDFAYNPMNLRFGALALYKNKQQLKISAYYNIFNVNEDVVNLDYIYAYLKSERIMFYYNRMATGSLEEKKRVHFKEFNKFIFPIPTTKEQQKIAQILITWSDSISKQEELIKSKEELKKGLMQKLLSGKIRFAGFADEWEEVRLGDLFNERTRRYKDLESHEIILYSELLSVGIKSGVTKRMDNSAKDNSSTDKSNYKVLNKNDIVYNTMRMWQGASGISSLRGIVSPAYTIVYLKDDYCIDFFGLLFKVQRVVFNFYRYSQGLTSDTWNIKYPHFSKVKVKVPRTKEEQQKIAKVLSNSDREIDLLKNELEELKEQKKGLMQKLLTGKVRVKV